MHHFNLLLILLHFYCWQADAGDQILLRRSLAQFRGFMSFLDGDIYFRRYHKLADMFVDKNRDLSPLILSTAVNINGL